MNTDMSNDFQHTTESDENLAPNTYWKSLGELARNKEYEDYEHREFGKVASELGDPVSRKSFLRIMGASIAMAGFAACRRPVQKILPYSRQPEDVTIGIPMHYASVFSHQDAATGILIENNEGRPSKIEGNPDHPASRGKTTLYEQAMILSMYDPDRSRGIRFNGEPSTQDDFVAAAASHFADRSHRVLFVSELSSSPTLLRLKEQALDQFPNARWINYEPFGEANAFEGADLAFGQRLRTVNHFDRADVIVALDDDFMSPQSHKNALQNARMVTDRRKVMTTDDTMNRLYVVEGTFTSTGSYADSRKKLKASHVAPFTYALAARLYNATNASELRPFAGVNNEFLLDETLEAMVEDLVAAQGSSLVTAGYGQPAEVHAAVAAINAALGNIGTSDAAPVTYHVVDHVDGSESLASFADAIDAVNRGEFDTMVMVGTNPAFNAPADIDVAGALDKTTVFHLADMVDETSKQATWHVNRAHSLEQWNDARSFTGAHSVVQPQILPLFDGWSEVEFLSTILTGEYTQGYDLVRDTWRSELGVGTDREWNAILHDGLRKDTPGAFGAVNPRLTNGFPLDGAFGRDSSTASSSTGSGSDMELIIRPDAKLFDGRYANNGWLMELPDPMSKITWDNVALMSMKTAEKLGIETERHLSDISAPIVKLTVEGRTIEIPAWIQPGHAEDSITVTVGYGREGLGRVADGAGTNTYPLRSTTAQYTTSVQVEVTDRDIEMACTQAQFSLEGRDMVRSTTLSDYKEHPNFATYKSVHGYEVPGIKEMEENGESDGPISLFNETYGPDYEPQWGMAIDLNACFGCGVCTIACQAENNIPVIGKKEVSRRRIMHWIRTDRYFAGDIDNPQVYHQPVPCMHCELAPCEQVCPVAATTHSDDGMNQMTYNRCIGTRYCANNCPFKVRRFNFFNYSDEYLTQGDDPEIVQMAMNPEVTVRFRGVMEKCSYCVQRVNREKITTKRETGSPKPADGTVLTACQQACPADAITFGDLTDNNSVVVQHKRTDRNYQMLEELNVRPRTSYLAMLKNPHPSLYEAPAKKH